MNTELDQTIANFLRSATKEKTILSSDELDKRAVELGGRIRNPELANEVASIAKRLPELMRSRHQRYNQSQIVSLLEELNVRRWPRSAELVYLLFLPQLGELDSAELVALAPTAKALTALCKKWPSARKAIDDIVARSPEQWLAGPIADWQFQRAKIPTLESAFIAALRLHKRAPGLKEPQELLHAAVQRDKKGLLLFAVLNIVNDSSALARFASVILAEPKIAKIYLSVIRSPKSQKKLRDRLPMFLRALVSAALADHGQAQLFRKTASLLMVGMISDIMIDRHSESLPPPLAMDVVKALSDLETAADSAQARKNTWIVHTLEKPRRETTDSKINLDAARILKIAFEQTERGSDALDVLEATAFNLGLRQIGEPNVVVAYDPHIHEDTVGGLHPGDTVKILRKGWSLDATPIIRAKVTYAET